MRTRNTLFILLSFILFSFQLSAQKQDKIAPALQGFLQTDFMIKFQDMRTEAEAAVNSFMSQSFNYPPNDVVRVQVAYDKTARRFNQILETIKGDFLDQNKLKLISSNPEYYAKGLELEMYKLNDFYAQNFQQALADVTGNTIDGSPVVLLLVQLISGISGTMDHFAKIKKEARRYNEAYLGKHFIEPFRFKLWEEISTGSAGGFNNYSNSQYQYNQPSQQDNNYNLNDSFDNTQNNNLNNQQINAGFQTNPNNNTQADNWDWNLPPDNQNTQQNIDGASKNQMKTDTTKNNKKLKKKN